MDGGSNSEGSLSIDWNTEDEMEIDSYTGPFHLDPPFCGVSTTFEIGEYLHQNITTFLGKLVQNFAIDVQISSSSSPRSKMIEQFIRMGFSKDNVEKAVKDDGGDNEEAILKALLTYDDGGSNSEGSLSIDWNTEDEMEIDSYTGPTHLDPPFCEVSTTFEIGEGSSSSSPRSKMIERFIRMGFSKNNVEKAVKDNGGDNEEAILEALLTYDAIKNLPPEEELVIDNPHGSSSNNNSLSVEVNCPRHEIQDSLCDVSENNNTFFTLVNMGYQPDDVSMTIERCGLDTSIADLSDFLCAAELAKEASIRINNNPIEENTSSHNRVSNKKKMLPVNEDEDDIPYRIPKPMIGFGVPENLTCVTKRTIPHEAIGPPYFYYENVALTPKGVWRKISRFLYDIIPEYVDSKYFCAAARKRGYIHNHPVQSRFPVFPPQKRTIHEVFQDSKMWWPSWDERTQLNCILVSTASAPLTNRIRDILESSSGQPSEVDKKFVMQQCRRYNLIWVARSKVAPLEPDEIEELMGFPKNHTRSCSRTERYTGLGNSFQVDTVAYHLSVLKKLYPSGINVLSLFSGIGGAEVALHRLGIRLKNVVSVEKSDACGRVVESWWNETNQTGNLVHISDVTDVNTDTLEKFMEDFGGFDLVVGGSPCNNLGGANRVSRDGLEGEQSSLFYHYSRILNHVMSMMKKRRFGILL